VTELIQQFNLITQWIATEIVSEANLKKRTNLLKHFIEIAWAAYGYRDFETTFAICLGLSQQPIARLNETWKALGNSTKGQWQKLQDFVSYQGNYKVYRNTMKKLLKGPFSHNVMPYFGMFLKDLTLIEENTTIIRNVGAVNFYKMRMVANLIGEIQKAQKSIFNFNKNVELLSFLYYGLPRLDEDTVWKLSRICEETSSGTASLGDQKYKPNNTFVKTEDVVIASSNPIFGLRNTPKFERKKSDPAISAGNAKKDNTPGSPQERRENVKEKILKKEQEIIELQKVKQNEQILKSKQRADESKKPTAK